MQKMMDAKPDDGFRQTGGVIWQTKAAPFTTVVKGIVKAHCGSGTDDQAH